jgi:hypothetical protein
MHNLEASKNTIEIVLNCMVYCGPLQWLHLVSIIVVCAEMLQRVHEVTYQRSKRTMRNFRRESSWHLCALAQPKGCRAGDLPSSTLNPARLRKH